MVYYTDIYVHVSAENVVKKANGTVTWANEQCTLKVQAVDNGLDNCVSNLIMKNSDNYNISKIS